MPNLITSIMDATTKAKKLASTRPSEIYNIGFSEAKAMI